MSQESEEYALEEPAGLIYTALLHKSGCRDLN